MVRSFYRTASTAGLLFIGTMAIAQTPPPAIPAGVMIEAEDFKPQGDGGWKVVMNGKGNYMVDNIGFNHISGERLLCADAKLKDAKAVATVQIPEAGDWRVWSRFEGPTETEERFRVEIRQNGNLVGQAVMGEKDAPKHWFGGKTAVGQYDASWGSEGLVEQGFDVKGLAAGPAEITLVSLEQPELAANRNVDFLWLSRDLTDSWRTRFPGNPLYPFLDAVLESMPFRYYMRLTSPKAITVNHRFVLNRNPWYVGGPTPVPLEAGKPSAWIPLKFQDTCHFSTVSLDAGGPPGWELKVEFATGADGSGLVRAIDWSDTQANSLMISLPPYPNKYEGERIITVEEQYKQTIEYLKAHPTTVGREPTLGLNWGGCMPIWWRGRESDASAELYHAIGMRVFVGGVHPPKVDSTMLAIARERFAKWGLTPGRTIAIGGYRFLPTPENIAAAKKAIDEAGLQAQLQRFDYGDEIGFSEWLTLIKPEELPGKFAKWQQAHRGAVKFDKPDSSAAASQANPEIYVDSMTFYEDAAIEATAAHAKLIPQQLGAEVLYGANVGCHPFYYPEIAKYIKWFRGGAANFGRHSEYFWQIGQPGPLINAYIADHFRSGMRDNPKALHLQYTMPHSPGNSDASFRRTAFSHLAHGARGLDYFGIGVPSAFTENHIDFRDPERYVSIRDVNRAIATIEDILPESRVQPSQVAMILSDSTERWDFAPIAMDQANFSVFSEQYKGTRLHYHTDRVGIYYALVHGSRSPDMLIEEDVIKGDLKNFKVAYWVGDCIEPKALAAIEAWVKDGGQLIATAGAFRFDPYRKPLDQGAALLGLKSAKLDEKTTFFRPQIELPRLSPIERAGDMPAFGVIDRIEVADGTTVVAKFADGSPAVTDRGLGKGKITYVAALPGVSYLQSIYQPAPVPTRGVLSHVTPTNFDKAAGKIILAPATQFATAQVQAEGGWLDARLLKSSKGLAVPIANYSADPEKPVTITLQGTGKIKKLTSANRGELKPELAADGSARVTYSTGFGDILRIESE